jgi:intein-encoded DNA endonuclease-like protein
MPIYKNYDKEFFKSWSHDMAYILGFLFADGNIVVTKRGTHFVSLYSADKEIVQAIQKCFKSDHVISARTSQTGVVYRIQIGSKEWFSDLCALGLFPNKTKRMELPTIPDDFFGDFVRGYFDGDGNVWSGYIHKKRPISLLTLRTSFTSGSHNYLVSLKNELRRHGVSGGSIFVSKTKHFSRLTFSLGDTLKLYKIMYNAPHKLYLKRKKSIFKQFVK